MMTLLIKRFIKNSENVLAPRVKQAYALLASTVGIVLNILLCTAKIAIGFATGSVAISADGFNNLSDAATSLAALLGFKLAGYGSGNAHPFGHGRIEWIMGIFTSLTVLLMGLTLADTSMSAIANTEKPLFSAAAVVVLVLSILAKGYMYLYNRQFAKITDSETLKATATDCISDAVSTFAVLLATVISHTTQYNIDGYCGALVSVFIIVAGVKSLWEVLGRIMGKAADESIAKAVLQQIKKYPEITAIHNLMIHDYGFGYVAISLRAEGSKKHAEQLYAAIHEISHGLYKQFHCDCCIQLDHPMEDPALVKCVSQKLYLCLQGFGAGLGIENLRLIKSGERINVAFDLIYPAGLQKSIEEICERIESEVMADNDNHYATIKSVIWRERFRLPWQNKGRAGG